VFLDFYYINIDNFFFISIIMITWYIKTMIIMNLGDLYISNKYIYNLIWAPLCFAQPIKTLNVECGVIYCIDMKNKNWYVILLWMV
jgi:hypothetical protein